MGGVFPEMHRISAVQRLCMFSLKIGNDVFLFFGKKDNLSALKKLSHSFTFKALLETKQ